MPATGIEPGLGFLGSLERLPLMSEIPLAGLGIEHVDLVAGRDVAGLGQQFRTHRGAHLMTFLPLASTRTSRSLV